MTNRDKNLYWTADSPYCRIVLWAMLGSPEDTSGQHDLRSPKRIHLNWDDLRNGPAIQFLSPEQTVPCLVEGSQATADSMRLLATIKGSQQFTDWLLSNDGALYRCTEGQLGLVMYNLYDGVTEKKVRQRWLNAITAIQKLISSSERAMCPSWGQMALHTFLRFCLYLKPEWQKDLTLVLQNELAQLEHSPTFLKLRSIIDEQPHQIPCGIFGDHLPTGC